MLISCDLLSDSIEIHFTMTSKGCSSQMLSSQKWLLRAFSLHSINIMFFWHWRKVRINDSTGCFIWTFVEYHRFKKLNLFADSFEHSVSLLIHLNIRKISLLAHILWSTVRFDCNPFHYGFKSVFFTSNVEIVISK